MKKHISFLLISLSIILVISYLLWPGNRVAKEDEEYVQNYYHVNLQDEGYWWYRYHGKYVNTKSINDKNVFTFENNDIILFSSNYEVESTSIRIYVSKSEEKLKGVLLKDIDRQDIEKVFGDDVVYEDEIFKVKVYRNISEKLDMFYSPVHIISLKNKDVNYCFEFYTESQGMLNYKNNQQEVNMNELNVYLEYVKNTLNN